MPGGITVGADRSAVLMLARVADSIYWMSRYVERAENVARFIEVNLNLMLDLPVGSAQQWQPLVETTGDATEFAKRYGAPRSATSSSSSRSIRRTAIRSVPACGPPARTPAPCARSSRRRCGSS